MAELTTTLQLDEESNHFHTTVPWTAASLIGVEKGADVVWTLEGDELVGRVAGGGDD